MVHNARIKPRAINLTGYTKLNLLAKTQFDKVNTTIFIYRDIGTYNELSRLAVTMAGGFESTIPFNISVPETLTFELDLTGICARANLWIYRIWLS